MSLSLVVQQSEPCGPHVTDESLTSAAGRLAAAGGQLVFAGRQGPVTAGAPSVAALLTDSPRPWYEWDAGLEGATLDDLVATVAGALDAGLTQYFFDEDECARLASAARRLGPLVSSGARFWLFGAGLVGRQTAALAASLGRTPEGFVDNAPRLIGGAVDGLPVRRPEALDPSRDVVVLCAGVHHSQIRAQLAAFGAPPPLHLSEYLFVLGSPSEPERGYGPGIWRDRFRYLGLFGRLADDESRRTLAGVLAHRVTLAGEGLSAIVAERQWVIPEVFVPFEAHVLVDGGAYDGDSAAAFLRWNAGPCKALHLFEPDDALCARAALRLEGTHGLVVHNAGLSDHDGFAGFAGTGGMDGALSDRGVTVRVTTVDGAVPDPVTYLKLDVEGAELAALEGSRRTVTRRLPVLAVAAYHKAEDLWSVPAWIDALDAGYALYLRHHTELNFETVLYASTAASSAG